MRLTLKTSLRRKQDRDYKFTLSFDRLVITETGVVYGRPDEDNELQNRQVEDFPTVPEQDIEILRRLKEFIDIHLPEMDIRAERAKEELRLSLVPDLSKVRKTDEV